MLQTNRSLKLCKYLHSNEEDVLGLLQLCSGAYNLVIVQTSMGRVAFYCGYFLRDLDMV